jgi:hypothetical protein
LHEIELTKDWLLDAGRCPTSWPLLLKLRRDARRGSTGAHPVLL